MGLRRFAILLLYYQHFQRLALAQKADVSFVAGGAFVSEDHVRPECNALFPVLWPLISRPTRMCSMKGQGPSAWQISNWHRFI